MNIVNSRLWLSVTINDDSMEGGDLQIYIVDTIYNVANSSSWCHLYDFINVSLI